MSDLETEARTEAPESTDAFVPLSENSSADVEATDDETLEDAEATEPQDTATEPTEDKPEPPSAKELGFDESTPEGKTAYKAMLSRWNKWVSRHEAKQKEAPAEQPRAAEQPKPEAAQDAPVNPIDAVYDVKFDDFKPSVTLAENSELGDYKDEIIAIATQVAQQMVQHTLKGVRANDEVFRQQMETQTRTGTARGVIETYQQAISAHPDFQNKLPEIQEFIAKDWVRQMAIDDPEELVTTLENRFGLDRNWRGEAQAETAQRGDEARRTATKLRSVVPRPSTAARLGGTPSGKMSGDEAFEAAWRNRQQG